ncbi:hypothetical protein HF670_06580 [Acidithiobacillus thiooxidans]|uniref:hypothetical protein n=1 Tax=Acidithiobacillus thiooxidans TaxID=930 RepID=UPI001C06B6AC|nr:hypothetical protein [Acidithiobacillus thiooxidans]MBU2797508.1 hypothetical protein [Acidithiobacillus sp. VAN18-2]MBU2839235.1 hypothetical protein [Acidithiobacillus thiooxidans]
MLVIDVDDGAWWRVVAGEEQSSLAFSGCHDAGGMTVPSSFPTPIPPQISGFSAYGAQYRSRLGAA